MSQTLREYLAKTLEESGYDPENYDEYLYPVNVGDPMFPVDELPIDDEIKDAFKLIIEALNQVETEQKKFTQFLENYIKTNPNGQAYFQKLQLAKAELKRLNKLSKLKNLTAKQKTRMEELEALFEC